MTYIGPYSLATLIYEPTDTKYIETITPNTILYFVFKEFPEFYKLINKAQLNKLYNSSYPITLFVPMDFKFDENIDKSTAVDMCRTNTIPLNISYETLISSELYLLRTMNLAYDIIVRNINGNIKIDGRALINVKTLENGTVFLI